MLEEIGGSMFSENNQISGRQVFRLLTYDFLGMGTLLLPTMLADTAGRDGIFCILAGILSTFLYLYRKFLKSSEIVYNRLEIKNDITKERRGLRHDVVYEVFCFGLG